MFLATDKNHVEELRVLVRCIQRLQQQHDSVGSTQFRLRFKLTRQKKQMGVKMKTFTLNVDITEGSNYPLLNSQLLNV